MLQTTQPQRRPAPWNKGKLIGQKSPLKLKEVWAIRIRLQLAGRLRDFALFNLAIDSKLRGCDLVSLRLTDVEQGGRIMSRAIIMQQKTQRPVQFEITTQTRESIAEWRDAANLHDGDYLFPSRMRCSPHQGDADLPTDQESSCGTTPPGAHQAGEHRAVSWDRA
jgi:integrase